MISIKQTQFNQIVRVARKKTLFEMTAEQALSNYLLRRILQFCLSKLTNGMSTVNDGPFAKEFHSIQIGQI